MLSKNIMEEREYQLLQKDCDRVYNLVCRKINKVIFRKGCVMHKDVTTIFSQWWEYEIQKSFLSKIKETPYKGFVGEVSIIIPEINSLPDQMFLEIVIGNLAEQFLLHYLQEDLTYELFSFLPVVVWKGNSYNSWYTAQNNTELVLKYLKLIP